jgi:hypothetical protein
VNFLLGIAAGSQASGKCISKQMHSLCLTRNSLPNKQNPNPTQAQSNFSPTHHVSNSVMLVSGWMSPLSMSLLGSHASGQCISTKSSCSMPKSLRLCCTDALQTTAAHHGWAGGCHEVDGKARGTLKRTIHFNNNLGMLTQLVLCLKQQQCCLASIEAAMMTPVRL